MEIADENVRVTMSYDWGPPRSPTGYARPKEMSLEKAALYFIRILADDPTPRVSSPVPREVVVFFTIQEKAVFSVPEHVPPEVLEPFKTIGNRHNEWRSEHVRATVSY